MEIPFPPFKPEDIESIKRRWPAALTPVYELDKCERGEQEPPGFSREHCFDFPDGIRMIASVENHDGTHALHVSFGINDGFQAKWRMDGKRAFRKQCELNYLTEFQAAGLINRDLLDTDSGPKAIHYWFRA